MQNIINEISNCCESIINITASNPINKESKYSKISIRPVSIKNNIIFQAEQLKNNQIFHTNIKPEDLGLYIQEKIGFYYKQLIVNMAGKTITYFINNKQEIKRISSKNNLTQKDTIPSNNKDKNYILKEGDNIPAFVDLGVFTKDFKIVKSKYDKYKQINRFIELIDHEFKNCQDKQITILDFGCGKSYLTFFVYYYFVEVKKINAKIIGYDLKADVVEHCNQIAKKYNYTNLEFVVSNVATDQLYKDKIDMVISLHACDTATDYALNYAIKNNVKHIFSVPCCQHEVNLSISKGGDLDTLLKHGIIKERVSALLTDSIRAQILEDMGYSVDLVEFVDFEHSPKNIMIRAKKCKPISYKNYNNIKELKDKYHFNQTLFNLIYNK